MPSSRHRFSNRNRYELEIDPRLQGMLKGHFGHLAQHQVVLAIRFVKAERLFQDAGDKLAGLPDDVPRTWTTRSLDIEQQRFLLSCLDRQERTDNLLHKSPGSTFKRDVINALPTSPDRPQPSLWTGQTEFLRLLEEELGVVTVYPLNSEDYEPFIDAGRLAAVHGDLRMNVAFADSTQQLQASSQDQVGIADELAATMLIADRPPYDSVEYLLAAVRRHEEAVSYYATNAMGIA